MAKRVQELQDDNDDDGGGQHQEYVPYQEYKPWYRQVEALPPFALTKHISVSAVVAATPTL